ncbi:MAG: glycerophosphodiester phosphodiesterase family protein, partial [Paracoccaceae bacterium]
MAEYQVVEAFRGGPDVVKIVGHRGARGYFPENSHVGFIETINMGVTLLEFDVVFTSDGVPVITHDHYLHAPTFRGPDRAFVNTQIKVSDLTWIQLQDYEIGVMDQESRDA